MRLEMVEISKLKGLRGNRDIDPRQVEKLKAAFLKKNLLHLRPVLINKNYEILDGQHRAAAAEELKMGKIPCIKMDLDVHLSDVQAINMNSKSWSALDYAKSYAAQGNPEYIKFLEFTEHSRIPTTECISLLRYGSIATSGKHIRNFRNGLFKITTQKFARDFERFVEQIEAEFPDCWKRCFLRAVLSMVRTEGFSQERLLYVLSRTKLKSRSKTIEYLEDLSDLYNTGLKATEKITFRMGPKQ